MKLFGAWSNKRIYYSLQKAILTVKSTDLVLEVGSDSTSHPAADVLLDKYFVKPHRYDPLVADRPMVQTDASSPPSRDKAFDASLPNASGRLRRKDMKGIYGRILLSFYIPIPTPMVSCITAREVSPALR